MGVLAKILIADHSTLSRNLALLSRQRLVTVSPRSTMRQRFVALTPEGTAALDRSLRSWRKVQAQFVASFGERRWKEIRKALEKLAVIAVRLRDH